MTSEDLGTGAGERDFQFLNPGTLSDGELEVAFVRANAADPERGFVPSYDFELCVGGQRAGTIVFQVISCRSCDCTRRRRFTTKLHTRTRSK